MIYVGVITIFCCLCVFSKITELGEEILPVLTNRDTMHL